jgi:flagellar secretion chaperone FliS
VPFASSSSSSSLRNRFVDVSATTASKPRLVVMLYERLERDIVEAINAFDRGSPSDAHAPLVHAQDIVQALSGALDVDAWSDGAQLQALYVYMLELLVRANVRKQAEPAQQCLTIVRPLLEAWRAALAASAGGQIDGRSLDG